MSTGIVAIATPPRMPINSAMTTKVYGRRSASLTIHMIAVPCPGALYGIARRLEPGAAGEIRGIVRAAGACVLGDERVLAQRPRSRDGARLIPPCGDQRFRRLAFLDPCQQRVEDASR